MMLCMIRFTYDALYDPSCLPIFIFLVSGALGWQDRWYRYPRSLEPEVPEYDNAAVPLPSLIGTLSHDLKFRKS